MSWGMLEWWKMGESRKTDSDACKKGKWNMRWESQRACSVVSYSFDPIDYDQPGFSVHRIFQSRILEQIAICYSRESSWPRDQMPFPTVRDFCNPGIEAASHVSVALTGRFFINRTTWESRGKQQREDGILPFFFFWPWGIRDLNSSTKLTMPPAVEARCLNYREVPRDGFWAGPLLLASLGCPEAGEGHQPDWTGMGSGLLVGGEWSVFLRCF